MLCSAEVMVPSVLHCIRKDSKRTIDLYFVNMKISVRQVSSPRYLIRTFYDHAFNIEILQFQAEFLRDLKFDGSSAPRLE
jgi:hypothetical protein